jgi:RNA polymerase sigma factor (sigma-70 family)
VRLGASHHWFEPELAPAIAALSEKQRSAVVLVHGFGWTVTEVAEMWGVTFSTVSAHIERAMAKLRKRLGVEE